MQSLDRHGKSTMVKVWCCEEALRKGEKLKINKFSDEYKWWRGRNAWPLHFCYLISCSNRSKVGVEKNSPSVISKASHNFLIVTVPGFWLSPFRMLFIVDCETADKFARPFGVIWRSLHSSRIRAAMVSCVVTFTPPQAIYHYDHKSSWRSLLVILHQLRNLLYDRDAAMEFREKNLMAHHDKLYLQKKTQSVMACGKGYRRKQKWVFGVRIVKNGKSNILRRWLKNQKPPD